MVILAPSLHQRDIRQLAAATANTRRQRRAFLQHALLWASGDRRDLMAAKEPGAPVGECTRAPALLPREPSITGKLGSCSGCLGSLSPLAPGLLLWLPREFFHHWNLGSISACLGSLLPQNLGSVE